MKTFEYEVVIENEDGRPTETARRIGFARPNIGEEVVVDDVIYTVRLVRHEQEHRTTRRIYTWPRVYVRKAVKTQPARG
jgi:hypothetical protein